MAKITGSLVITGLDGSGWESDGDGRADGVGVRGARYAVASVAPRACAAPKQPRTTHRALASQHPVHEGAQEHHNAHDPVRGKKGRIEPRQVSGLHEPVGRAS